MLSRVEIGYGLIAIMVIAEIVGAVVFRRKQRERRRSPADGVRPGGKYSGFSTGFCLANFSMVACHAPRSNVCNGSIADLKQRASAVLPRPPKVIHHCC